MVLLVLAAAACSGDPGTTASPSAPPIRSTPTGSASPGGSTSPQSSASATVKPSSTTDAIKVSGKFGDSPKVTFTAPFVIDKTQTRVLSKGSGATIKAGTVELNYYGVDGRTGKKFDDSYSRKQTASFPLEKVIPGFAKGLTGQKVGSRVLIAITSDDGYGAQGNPRAGINPGDTLLFVVDVVAAQLDGPSGKKVTPPSGLPVVTDTKGVPSIAVPKTDPPAKLVVQPLIAGQGKRVAKTDAVVTNYLAVGWTDGATVFDTYKTGPDTSAVASTIPGLTQALVGQRVGSRLLVIVPPAQGYPDGNATPKVDKDVTLVFVVDVLFTSAAQ